MGKPEFFRGRTGKGMEDYRKKVQNVKNFKENISHKREKPADAGFS